MSKEGDAIKALRQARGLTQKQLANLSGIGENRFSSYETGLRPVPLFVCQELAEFFGVKTEDITDARPYEFKYDMVTYSCGKEISRFATNNRKEAIRYYKRNADYNATRVTYCGQKLTYLQGDSLMNYAFQNGAFALCRRKPEREEKHDDYKKPDSNLNS